MEKKKFPITNIGSVSLMMIFIVLCMVTFAALSLSSATADYRFSQKRAEHTGQYYEASNAAEEMLSEIDGILAEAYAENRDAQAYYSSAAARLSDLGGIEMDGSSKLSYQTPLNDTQALLVELYLYPPEEIQAGGAPAFYRITSWNEIHTEEWEGDNSVKLIEIE